MYFLFWKIFLKASTLFLISLRIHTKRFSSLWSESHSVVSDSLQPHDYTIHGILQARILEWIAFLFSRGSSQLGIEPRSPTWQANSLQAEPQGKPKNTGVGSLLLLQGIFPTHESNWGLLALQADFLTAELPGKPKVAIPYPKNSSLNLMACWAVGIWWCCESAALNMPENLENSAVATGLEKVTFHANP